MRLMLLVGEWPATDKVCGWCDEAIRVGEFAPQRGTPVHYYCAVRGVVGPLDHQARGPHEGGDCLPDDPALTKREAALASYRYWRGRQEARNGGHHRPESTLFKRRAR